jgi:hypothetical protein
MDKKESIVAAGNTFNPCLIILSEKGYRVTYTDGARQVLWHATNDTLTCSACSPPELLGIVAMREFFGADWNRQDPDLISKAEPE